MKKSNYFNQGTRNWFKSTSPNGTKTNWDRPISSNEMAKIEDMYSNISEPSEEYIIKSKLIAEKRTKDKLMKEKLIREKLIKDTEDKIRQRNSKEEQTTPTLFDDL